MDDYNHLTAEEVHRIVSYVSDCDAVLVGGQSLNIWARIYEGASKLLYDLGPFTSRDVDFYENNEAAQRLRDSLANGQLITPDPDDHTPNAAIVTGQLGDRTVLIDFMASVMGVEDTSIRNNFVAIEGIWPGSDKPGRILLMHPHDCVRSRLSNVNKLGRHDDHAINQTRASLIVLELFLKEMLAHGRVKLVQSVLHSFQFTIRDRHLGQASHIEFGNLLDPIAVMEAFTADASLDPRWRELILGTAIERLRSKQHEVETRAQPASGPDT